MLTAEDYKNGQILLIDKPLTWTSFQAVNKLRWEIRQRFAIKKIKVGHAGTLDPLATGLLINSSIRLSVYSKRFTIKTMQMVGATKRFIRRPFIWKSIRLGITGALVASLGLAAVFYYTAQYFPELQLLSNKEELIIVFSGVFLVGIFITWFSTYFATQRFLNLKTDQLYY